MISRTVFKHVLAAIATAAIAQAADLYAESPHFEQLKTECGLDLFRWQDVCNVYVLRDGDAAMLIDVGDGSVLDHLGELGIRKLEWVLLTSHHRELCQGHPKLKPGGRRSPRRRRSGPCSNGRPTSAR